MVHFYEISTINCDTANFKIKATEIYGYIEQDDNTDGEDEWKGNHSFANGLRNKMTHRNSPNVSVMSDFDMNLKCHPVFQIKRVIEDYRVVSQHIKDILDQIENDIMGLFNYREI